MTWRSSCRVPRRRSGTGSCGKARQRSSPPRPEYWTRPRPAPPRRWFWTGGRLTPAGLRSAIARAVMEVAPEKARKRRELAAKDARVQRWAEDSGNAALMGRELPPAEVLAADQRISAWARQLKKAGLDGSMDELGPGPTWTSCWGKTPAPADPARTASPTMPPSMAGRTAGKVRDMAARTGRTVPQTVAGTAQTTQDGRPRQRPAGRCPVRSRPGSRAGLP